MARARPPGAPSGASPFDFLTRAEELRQRGRAVEALALCRTGLAAVPTFHSARALLGRLLLETGDPARARAELDLVLGRSPRHLAARHTLAHVLARHGDAAEAAEAAEAARGLAPRDAALRAALDRLLGPPVSLAAPSPVQAPRKAAPATAALERWLAAVRRACPETLPDAS